MSAVSIPNLYTRLPPQFTQERRSTYFIVLPVSVFRTGERASLAVSGEASSLAEAQDRVEGSFLDAARVEGGQQDGNVGVCDGGADGEGGEGCEGYEEALGVKHVEF